MSECEAIELYLGKIVEPGFGLKINPPVEGDLIITNICFGELPDDFVKEPVRLSAVVTSIILSDKSGEIDIQDPQKTVTKVLLATLIPGEIEHRVVDCSFSKLDSVTLTVEGNYPVHVSGYFEPEPDDSE